MEPCQSGLTYLFAKEAGCNSPREFESRRLRTYKKEPEKGLFYCAQPSKTPARLA